MDGSPVRSQQVQAAEQQRLANIADYFDRATADYRHWDAALHMHFGYWRWPLSPFKRAAMVEQLSAEVHDRLGLMREAKGTILDLGCGVGTSARQLAVSHPAVRVLGLSVSPMQVELGNRSSAKAKLGERVELREADYRSTTLASASVIGAYAIESACYDGADGAGLIREAARVLRPGARLIIADGFRRKLRVPWAARAVERRMLAGWTLPRFNVLDRFNANLRKHGFEIEATRDISLRVLPSVLQVPLVSLVFRLREGFNLDERREGNASAPIWGLLCALLWPRRFGYYLITARRR